MPERIPEQRQSLLKRLLKPQYVMVYATIGIFILIYIYGAIRFGSTGQQRAGQQNRADKRGRFAIVNKLHFFFADLRGFQADVLPLPRHHSAHAGSLRDFPCGGQGAPGIFRLRYGAQ